MCTSRLCAQSATAQAVTAQAATVQAATAKAVTSQAKYGGFDTSTSQPSTAFFHLDSIFFI
jgi:hypothetical protein